MKKLANDINLVLYSSTIRNPLLKFKKSVLSACMFVSVFMYVSGCVCVCVCVCVRVRVHKCVYNICVIVRMCL